MTPLSSPTIAEMQAAIEAAALMIATFCNTLLRENVPNELVRDLTLKYAESVIGSKK